MSNGTPNPPPSPPTASPPTPNTIIPPAVSWPTVIASILAALLAGLHMATPPTPSPIPSPTPIIVPPVPDSIPIVVPPRPGPLPSPSPEPTPIVPPGPISSGVSITDVRGNALGNSVMAGQMFQVSASPGVTLTAVPGSDQDADIAVVADNKLVCTLRNGCKLQIVVTGAGRPTIVSVVCNQAPQPPPKPDPTPAPIPTPLPITNNGPLSIGIVEDAANRPVAVASILNNYKLWEGYRSAGHTIRIWNGGSSPSTEPAAQQDIASAKAANVAQPAIIIRNKAGAVLYVGPLPTVPNDVDSLIKPIAGANR